MNSIDATMVSQQIVAPAVGALLKLGREVLSAYRERTAEISRGNDLAEAESAARLGEAFTATYGRLRNPRGGQR